MSEETGTMSKKANEKTHILQKMAQPSTSSSDEPTDQPVSETCQDAKDTGSSSLSTAAFNYINSIIGSGIIGMPYAFRLAGVGLGSLILIFTAIITDYSLILMVKSGNLAGSNSYQGMVQKAFGRIGYAIISLIQFVYPFIAMVSYTVIVGDTVTKVVVRLVATDPSASVFASREFISLVTTIIVTLPLSLYKDIGKLAKTSLVSMIFVVFIIGTVFYRLHDFEDIIPPSDDAWEFANPSGILQALSITTFAFMCHHNTFLLYCSIDDTSLTKWNKVTHASIIISLVTMALMAFGGYATFTGFVQGDLLNNYCWSDDLMTVSRLLFSITILLTYPIECFVCREVVQHVIWGTEKFAALGEKQANRMHVFVTAIIVILTYCFSLITDCLGVVLEINGLVAAIPLAFTIPALSYLKLEEGPLLSSTKIPALLLAIFGIVASVCGILTLVTKGPDTCQDVEDMPYCVAGGGVRRSLVGL